MNIREIGSCFLSAKAKIYRLIYWSHQISPNINISLNNPISVCLTFY